MTLFNDNPATKLKTAPIRLGNGWTGKVVLSGISDQVFTVKDWCDCLAEPEALLEQPVKMIKSDGSTTVLVSELSIASNTIKIVLKSRLLNDGFIGFCRSLLCGKAIRNFDTAVMLFRKNIPVAEPLAALQSKRGLSTVRSIYITRYSEGCMDLHSFVRNRFDLFEANEPALRKNLCFQIAQILAALHNASLWHRDAKAGNFLVTPYRKTADSQNGYTISLVDMDGIKPYRFRAGDLRYRSLCKLAATLLWNGSLNRTDYLRIFRIYSNLTGLSVSQGHRLYRSLAVRAAGIRLLTMATSAMQSKRGE